MGVDPLMASDSPADFGVDELDFSVEAAERRLRESCDVPDEGGG